MSEDRVKIPLSELQLENNEDILKIVKLINDMLKPQGLKPIKLYIGGDDACIYSHVKKEELQNCVKKAIQILKQEDIKGLPELPISVKHIVQEKPITIEEILPQTVQKEISEIPQVDTQVIQSKEVPKTKKVSICCSECGYVSFISEDDYNKTKDIQCPSCGTVQELEKQQRPRKLLAFTAVQTLLVLLIIWYVYWAHVYDILYWGKSVYEGLFTFHFYMYVLTTLLFIGTMVIRKRKYVWLMK